MFAPFTANKRLDNSITTLLLISSHRMCEFFGMVLTFLLFLLSRTTIKTPRFSRNTRTFMSVAIRNSQRCTRIRLNNRKDCCYFLLTLLAKWRNSQRNTIWFKENYRKNWTFLLTGKTEKFHLILSRRSFGRDRKIFNKIKWWQQ